LFDQLTVPASVAVAPPLLVNQVVNELLTLAVQETVSFVAGVIFRLPPPPTRKVPEVVAVLPQASVAVKITVAELQQAGTVEGALLVHVTLLQLSVATAPPWLFNHA
jgi:hypothetical protein